MEPKVITVYSDPGHAWAEIPVSELYDLGIAAMISPYSYEKGETAYLEEDCDLGILVMALKLRGIGIEFVEIHTNYDSPIRNYRRYGSNKQWSNNSDDFRRYYTAKTENGISLQ